MGGRGPAPKDPDKRARRNKQPELRVILTEPATQPELPRFSVEEDGELTEFTWPGATQEWWRMWAEHPISDEFSDADWSFLLDTALVHAAVWSGSIKYAGELRLRVAKFGVTPEDRARLRIMFAIADKAEGDEPAEQPTGRRGRYGHLGLGDGTAG